MLCYNFSVQERWGRDYRNRSREISLFSVLGKVYGRVLEYIMLKLNTKNVNDELGGFRRGRECLNKIFALKVIIEKHLGCGWNLYPASMKLRTAYDEVDGKGSLYGIS